MKLTLILILMMASKIIKKVTAGKNLFKVSEIAFMNVVLTLFC